MDEMTINTVVNKSLRAYDSLEIKSKPRDKEWTVLSGIAFVRGNKEVECVALGTGTKCLSSAKLTSCNGNILHDCHGEIVAMRAFNRFLLDECLRLSTQSSETSPFVRRREFEERQRSSWHQPFAIADDLMIAMYCSEVPCGDASMELVMEAQEDATPWPVKPGSTVTPGRGQFAELGIVRRKPARGDSPPTCSKSCSDKLALKECTSLLSGPMSLLISPTKAYLDTLIIPSRRYRAKACERAFSASGRMGPVVKQTCSGGYSFQPFRIATTPVDAWDLYPELGPHLSIKPSNISAIWTGSTTETVINGVLMGRRQTDPSGASSVCRRRMLEDALLVIQSMPHLIQKEIVGGGSYLEIRDCSWLEPRQEVKFETRAKALKGWIPSRADDFDFDI